MKHCRRDGKGLHILVFLLVFLWSMDEMHGYKQGNSEEAPAMLNCSSNEDQYLDLNKKSANRPAFEVVSRKCLQVN